MGQILTPKNSIEFDAGQLQLISDSAAPGNSKYWGTDSGGTKGFHDLPASSGLTFTAVKTSAYTAVEDVDHVLVDSDDTGTFAVTLPSSPSVGGHIAVTMEQDHATNIVTIASAQLIMGSSTLTKYVLALEGDTLDFWFAGGGTGWALYDGIRRHTCRMARNTAQSINSGVDTKIAFDGEDWDVGLIGDFTTNDRVNIRRQGFYLIDCFWQASGIDDGEFVWVRPKIDGGDVRIIKQMSSLAGSAMMSYGGLIIDIAAGSSIEMYVQHDEGAAVNTLTTAHGKARMTVVELR